MNKKRLFSGISSAVLILGSLSPTQAFAQTEGEMAFQESVGINEFNTTNAKASWSFVNGVLTIEGECNIPKNDANPDYVPAEWPWREFKDKVVSINFGNGFKLSGTAGGIFEEMPLLEKVDFTNCNTEDLKNMYAMFYKCPSLKTVDLSGLDTSKVESMKSLFYGCSNLQSVNLKDINTNKVRNMAAMFAFCDSLTFIDVSSLDNVLVDNMDYMFGSCKNLAEIKFEDFDISSVQNLNNMFYNCKKLTELDLRRWLPAANASMKNMFLYAGVETVLITESGGDLLPALAQVSPTWHVNKKGPYAVSASDGTKTVLEKIKEDRLDGPGYATLNKKLEYNLHYLSQENETINVEKISNSSQTGKCDFTVVTLVPERAGYTFLGWADTPNAAQAKYHAGDKVTVNLNTDGQHKNLYAVWRRNSSSGSSSGSSSSSSVARSSVYEMHRMYNPNSGEHFYTKEVAERDHLVNVGWQYEGPAWYAPKSSGSPVYRLYNPNAGDHHYTLSAGERDELVRVGWKDEGIGWYSASSRDGQAVHRQYNPNAVAGSHNFTTDEYERDYLINNGWNHEGVAWYGVHPKNIKK